jgi:hypothetical protein
MPSKKSSKKRTNKKKRAPPKYRELAQFCYHWDAHKHRHRSQRDVPNPFTNAPIRRTGPTAKHFDRICSGHMTPRDSKLLSDFAKGPVQKRKYQAQHYDDWLALIYLLHKHDDICTIFLREPWYVSDRTKSGYVGRWKLLRQRYYEFEWDCAKKPGARGKLIAPHDFWKQISQCCRRFVISSVIINPCKGKGSPEPMDTSFHGNFLIIDRKKRIVEVIEPLGRWVYKRGTPPGRGFYDVPVMIKQLRQYFAKGGYRVKGPQELVKSKKRAMGFQTAEEWQSAQWKLVDWSPGGGGFCSAWSVFLTDLRLSNPDTDYDHLTHRVLQALKRGHFLTIFINQYIEYVVRQGERILKRYNKGHLPNTQAKKAKTAARYLANYANKFAPLVKGKSVCGRL